MTLSCIIAHNPGRHLDAPTAAGIARRTLRAGTGVLLCVGLALLTTACAHRSGSAGSSEEGPGSPEGSGAPASDAEQIYRSYIDAVNDIDLDDPTTFIAPSAFTTETLQTTDLTWPAELHARGFSLTGEVTVESFRVIGAARDGSVRATSCNDVSSVRLVDRNGVNTLGADAPEAYRMQLDFVSRDSALLLDSAVGEAVHAC